MATKKKTEDKMIKVTLKKSLIGGTQVMKDNARSLGLTKINSSAVHKDTPAIRGMINVISHLVAVEEA